MLMAIFMHNMNIDLRSLRHIVVLSRLLSYSRAAEQLGITQSALSRSIQAFERRAGIRLFDRDRSGVHITTVGRSFVGRAAALLSEAEELEQMLRRSGDAQTGEVAFGMAPLPAKALLAAVESRVLTEAPELRTAVIVRRAEALLPMLAAGEIEFFVCAEGQVADNAPTRSAPLGWFPNSLIVRPDHPILQAGANAGQSYPVLLANEIETDRHAFLESRPYLSGPQHVIEDYGAAACITMQTDAIWLSSPYAAADEIRQGRLVEIPVGGKRTGRFRMMMYSLNRRSLSPAAQLFRQQLQQQITALASGS